MATNQYTGRIRYFFDAGSGVCLWASDDATKEHYGHDSNADNLPLPTNTQRWLQYLIARYDTSLNWDAPVLRPKSISL